jgi:hypothetical protein
MKRVLAILTLLGGVAAADPAAVTEGDPCVDSVGDPAATPIRDVGLDMQRSACLRSELSAAVTTHALIDTPGFRGMLGGDFGIAGRLVVRADLELGVRLRIVDYTFVQNAVNKVTETRYGPLGFGAAYGTRLGPRGRLAVVLAGELPYTRDDMDTTHAGGELTGVVTGELASRWLLHARLGAVGAIASSTGGTLYRLGLRAGADLAWRVLRRLTFLGGVETQAGWNGGLDTVMLRTGVHFRPTGAWRGVIGIGAPLGGNERTNAILDLGIARDLD